MYFFILNFYYLSFILYACGHVYPTPECGGQRTTCDSQFCPSTRWILWLELRLSSLAAGSWFHPLSHLPSFKGKKHIFIQQRRCWSQDAQSPTLSCNQILGWREWGDRQTYHCSSLSLSFLSWKLGKMLPALGFVVTV